MMPAVQLDQSINPNLERDGTISVLIVSFFLFLFGMTYQAVYRVDDEHILSARTQSLALWGTLEEPQVYGNQRVQELRPMGDPATQIEPGISILGSFFYKTASALSLGGIQAFFTLNIFVSALTVGVLYWMVRLLGYPTRVAVLTGMIFGAGTMIWPYATALYRDSLAMLMASIAILGWLLALKMGRVQRNLGISLMAIGVLGGILTKNSIAVLVPSIGVTGLILALQSDKKYGVRRSVGWVSLGLCVVVLLIPIFLRPEGPFARFSIDYYSFLGGHFFESLWTGYIPAFLGPFLSPAKSIFLFSPPLILCLFGVWRGRKQHWDFFLLVSLMTFLLASAQALFYRDLWAGFFGWGSRFMLPTLPALMAFGAPAIAWLLDGRSRSGRAMFWGIFVISILVQLAGAFVDWEVPYRQWLDEGMDPFTTTAAWDLRYFTLPSHLSALVRLEFLNVAWFRLFKVDSLKVLVLPFVGIVLAVITLMNLRRSVLPDTSGRFRGRVALIALMIGILFTSVFTWVLFRSDPYWRGNVSAYREAFDYVGADVAKDDLVIVDAYGTDLWRFWMNNWQKPVRWYSLPFEIPPTNPEEATGWPSEATIALLGSGIGEDFRIWYVVSNEAPDYSQKIEFYWLLDRYELANSRSFEDEPEGDVIDVHLFEVTSTVE